MENLGGVTEATPCLTPALEVMPAIKRCAGGLPATTLSQRSALDMEAPMGCGATRSLERVLASCGLLASAALDFVAADDVPQGGVLLALPALLTEGL